MHAVEQKAWKGKGMEGTVARWYARTRGNDMADFRREAKAVAERLRSGCSVLEVAPGPGFFAIELAKLRDCEITGLDISQTLVEIATENARNAGAKIDFRLGNASAMPFAGESFDFIYCSAAFKNFSEPVKALDEMYRVLRPGGAAVVVDLCKDASLDEIDAYVKQSGRSRIDSWMTKWTFRHVLLKRAYTKEEFVRMAAQSRFGKCQINVAPIGFEVRLTKPTHVAAGVAYCLSPAETAETVEARDGRVGVEMRVSKSVQEGDTEMKTSTAQPAAIVSEGTVRWPALGAVVGPVLFTLSWFVLGFLSPGYTLWGSRIAPYSPISQPVSGLGLGSTGPFMNAAFLLSGLLLLVGVTVSFQCIREVGVVARRICAAMLALSPLGVILDGIFTLESMLLHSVGFLLAAATPVVSFLITGLVLRRVPRWRRFGTWLLLGSPLTLVLLVLFFATFNPTASGAGRGVGGLVQRVLIIEVHAWFVALGWLAFSSSGT